PGTSGFWTRQRRRSTGSRHMGPARTRRRPRRCIGSTRRSTAGPSPTPSRRCTSDPFFYSAARYPRYMRRTAWLLLLVAALAVILPQLAVPLLLPPGTVQVPVT